MYIRHRKVCGRLLHFSAAPLGGFLFAAGAVTPASNQQPPHPVGPLLC